MRPDPNSREKEEARYSADLRRLEGFRSVLPQVRRALANIATYTICDDHEITDDWYLDGAWCCQVLASALGRRVLRNGLLAYALFQAWALEWGTFQHLLKTVSPMKRVLFLSGDVHYAFGSSLEYWDERTQATARFVNYTSSPLHNEGVGSHMAALAVGYPRLLHLLRREGTATVDFFAWDIPVGNHSILNQVLALIRKRLYFFWWSIPRLIAARRSHDEIILPTHGWLKGYFHTFPPDRVYRLHYRRNSLARDEPESCASRYASGCPCGGAGSYASPWEGSPL